MNEQGDTLMFTILKKEELSQDITLFEIQAPDIARKAKPGNCDRPCGHDEVRV
jgi:NAD(P)H-flavin reductase